MDDTQRTIGHHGQAIATLTMMVHNQAAEIARFQALYSDLMRQVEEMDKRRRKRKRVNSL
jgi:hypothetical protein